MYRIAVIQNEVEMQHSGYVDSIPKYKKQDFDLKEHVFNRFSSVNIRDLFIQGGNYLLDYDCLIIGTNATSDGDVYTVLCDEENQKILEKYISMGKGLLICSQKKLRKDTEYKGNALNVRKTWFMPKDYEYSVISRPKNENSSDGSVFICKQTLNNIQAFLMCFPQKITNEMIEDHCTSNDFQKHYYRDYIVPSNDASYFPVLLDIKNNDYRNTLMVACPQRNEKIVISTMALDWAGHYELIENILYYLIIGIPTVAFISKEEHATDDFMFMMSEADISRISYKYYAAVDEVLNSPLRCYHTLYVFSPSFEEEEVAKFWENYVRTSEENKKLFYYKYINGDLVLVSFSYYSYMDVQKREVATWLNSKSSTGLWDNSFWKTYDVLFALHRMGFSIASYINNVFLEIDKHYKTNPGSYDGVLAPTCGLLELESLIMDEYKGEKDGIENYYEETKSWLINRYQNASNYNKKFIIRSFYNSGRLDDLGNSIHDFDNELNSVALDDKNGDKLDVDLCLDVDVCLIYVNTIGDKKDITNRIRECVDKILSNQMQNGRWDNNLGKTARLLVFLLKNKKEKAFEKLLQRVNSSIESGIIALRNSYEDNNWENNIVTTANSITALMLYEENVSYKSKDFLNQVNKEVKLTESYNSLILALKTIDSLTKRCSDYNKKLKKLEKIESEYKSNRKKLVVVTAIASISILLVISYYLFLYLKNASLFKSMLMESLMWIPIVIGVAITTIIEGIPKFVMKLKKKK